MLASIMQPTYLPWIGYFDLIDQVDVFVLLDTVQFEKGTWQQRNQLRTSKGLELLTVPVLKKHAFGQRIHEVRLNGMDFTRKHAKGLWQNYRSAPHFEAHYEAFCTALSAATADQSLCHLTSTLIHWFCSRLGITTRLVAASDLEVEGDRSERLVAILSRLGAENYLSALGAQGYLQQDAWLFAEKGISVSLHHYVHPEYRQCYQPFLPYACILDLLFNEGDRSLKIIRSGRRTATPLTSSKDKEDALNGASDHTHHT